MRIRGAVEGQGKAGAAFREIPSREGCTHIDRRGSCDGQTDAEVAARSLVAAFKQMGKVLFSDACTIVGDADLQMAVGYGDGGHHPGLCVADCVGQQIFQYLGDQVLFADGHEAVIEFLERESYP